MVHLRKDLLGSYCMSGLLKDLPQNSTTYEKFPSGPTRTGVYLSAFHSPFVVCHFACFGESLCYVFGVAHPLEFKVSVKIEDTQAVSEQRARRGFKKGEGTGTQINTPLQAQKEAQACSCAQALSKSCQLIGSNRSGWLKKRAHWWVIVVAHQPSDDIILSGIELLFLAKDSMQLLLLHQHPHRGWNRQGFGEWGTSSVLDNTGQHDLGLFQRKVLEVPWEIQWIELLKINSNFSQSKRHYMLRNPRFLIKHGSIKQQFAVKGAINLYAFPFKGKLWCCLLDGPLTEWSVQLTVLLSSELIWFLVFFVLTMDVFVRPVSCYILSRTDTEPPKKADLLTVKLGCGGEMIWGCFTAW